MWQWLTQSVTEATADPPKGNALAALAIKADTTNFVYDSTKPEAEYVKGTVAACLNARASERGVIRFIVRVTKDDGTEEENAITKQLEYVLSHPNPVQSRVDFMEEASHFHDACGQAFIYFVDGDAKLPAEMWLLPSWYVTALFDTPENPVPIGYRFSDGRVISNANNVCMVRQNSVKSAPYIGRGFLQDHIDSAILYDLVVTSQKNWFYSGGAPNVALQATKGTHTELTPDQITNVQSLWNKKYNPSTGTSNIAIIPDGFEIKDFGPQELNLNTSKEEVRDSIREALQTPKIILGDTDNVNHNNGQTALAMFERLIVQRWAEKFASALEHYFNARNYERKLVVKLDPEVLKAFTQIPSANGIVDLPSQFQFSAPNDPNG